MRLITHVKTRCLAALASLFLLASPAFAAGTVPLALTQQIDINGQPLANCTLYFFAAGTVATPQNSYSDFGLSQNPLPQVNCDQTGRLPMFWLADGLIHIRLIDASGLQVLDTTMQVLGPSSGGGGGGGTVDPTTIAATGDLKWRLDKAPISGWVRINGLTIGDAVSGATERANADTQALFVYIWTTFSQPSGNVICPVIGGLGASALVDFNANKQITLEDARARAVMALDDMGNSALGGYSGVTFTKGSATTAGALGGLNATTLTVAQLPPGITSNGTNTITVDATAGYYQAGGNTNNQPNLTGAFSPINGTFTAPHSTGSNNISVTSNNTLGQSFPSVPSALLGTLYWKL